MRVFKFFVNFNKEEAWLADMATKGYRLTKASSGFYTFDQFNHSLGEVTFKVDCRTFKKDEDFGDYCTMFEDSGWLHIAGTKYSGSQYFVKIRSDASEDIFSDNLSRAGRYKRISSMWLCMSLCYFTIFISLCINLGNNNYGHGFQLYLTPGLWDMKGKQFVLHFLFETPFALFRLFPFVFFIIMIAFFVYYTVKSLLLYKRELRNH